MKLSNIFPDYLSLDDAGKEAFIRSYRDKRNRDFEIKALDFEEKPKRTSKKEEVKVSLNLSPEEMALLEKLGISTKKL
jgi:hypothetical protein